MRTIIVKCEIFSSSRYYIGAHCIHIRTHTQCHTCASPTYPYSISRSRTYYVKCDHKHFTTASICNRLRHSLRIFARPSPSMQHMYPRATATAPACMHERERTLLFTHADNILYLFISNPAFGYILLHNEKFVFRTHCVRVDGWVCYVYV